MRQEVFKIHVGAASGVFGVPTWLPRFLNNTLEVKFTNARQNANG